MHFFPRKTGLIGETSYSPEPVDGLQDPLDLCGVGVPQNLTFTGAPQKGQDLMAMESRSPRRRAMTA